MNSSLAQQFELAGAHACVHGSLGIGYWRGQWVVALVFHRDWPSVLADGTGTRRRSAKDKQRRKELRRERALLRAALAAG